MTKKFHIAIATANVAASVEDYSRRLDAAPCVLIAGEYALWRTQTLNLSVRFDAGKMAGEVRHLGWEDSQAQIASAAFDVNGIIWEHFSAAQQADEIKQRWPSCKYDGVDSQKSPNKA